MKRKAQQNNESHHHPLLSSPLSKNRLGMLSINWDTHAFRARPKSVTAASPSHCRRWPRCTPSRLSCSFPSGLNSEPSSSSHSPGGYSMSYPRAHRGTLLFPPRGSSFFSPLFPPALTISVPDERATVVARRQGTTGGDREGDTE